MKLQRCTAEGELLGCDLGIYGDDPAALAELFERAAAMLRGLKVAS